MMIGNGQINQLDMHEIPGALNCMHDQQIVFAVRERCGCEGGGKGLLVQENKSGTISTSNDQFIALGIDNYNQTMTGVTMTLRAEGELPCVVALDRAAYNQGQNAQFDIGVDESGKAQKVIAKGPGAVAYDLDSIILRRLTPTECARLQGMPDWWCDDVPHSDTAEYKMWGNGIALPCALYIMEGLAEIGGDDE